MAWKVPFVDPRKNYQLIQEEIDAAYSDVMSKGDLIDRGQLKSFEENLAKFVGTKYAVGLNSGYDALHMSLRAAGIGDGDEMKLDGSCGEVKLFFILLLVSCLE